MLRRLATLLTASTLALTVAVPVTATAAAAAPAAAPAVVSPVPRSELCNRPLRRLDLYVGSSRLEVPNTLTLLGESQTIDVDTFSLANVPFKDPSRVLWYRSMLWAAVAAVDHAEHGNWTVANWLATQMIRAADAFPDPGSATPEALKWSNAIGWDEGTAFRRAQALLCLSVFTGAERLRPLLQMHANALMDPSRYFGPPNRPVHNHGMLANLVLIDIGQVLNEPTYRNVAMARLANDYATQFSPKGWAVESATGYQSVNINGWTEVETEMRERGMTADADNLAALLQKAVDVAAALVSPTGAPAMIGNTRPTDIILKPAVAADRPLLLHDEIAGVATGRWSWTDRLTSWWTVMNRLRRGAHGHTDATSITWQSGGVPVLVDVGQPDYDVNVPTTWSKSPAAHNRSVPAATPVVRDSQKIRKLRIDRKGSIDRLAMQTTDQGPLQTREALIDDSRGTLQVTDQTDGAQTQHWHLDPVWRPVKVAGSQAEFVGPRNRRLVVSAPGASMTLLTASTDPMGGWVTTGFEKLAPAPELLVSGDRTISTTFQISKAGATTPAPRSPRVDPALTTVASGTIRLAWTAPRAPKATKATASDDKRKRKTPPASGITGYRVQRLDPDGLWRTMLVDTRKPLPQAKARKLTNGTKYRFRVAALTASGTTPFGPASRYLTPCAVPARITEPLASVADDKTVRLTWTAPTLDGGCPVAGYEVTVPEEDPVRANSNRAQVRLEKGALKVRVAAVNAAGSGRPVILVLRRDGKKVTVS